jgi:glyoxylase-like metal-dependent hydrolase (beta-lactamase superfamily II)
MLFVPVGANHNMENRVAERPITASHEASLGNNIFIVAPGVWRMKDIFVNVFIIQNLESTNWVLVDTGIKTSAPKIKSMVRTVFGSEARPSSIILTHGRFDHVGSVEQLADEWGVPVYCHHLEAPYLTGRSSYPPPDPTVGGGMMSLMSFTFPKKPINIQEHLRELPEDGSVPDLHDWQWIHTPGHAPGHISLFRKRDGVLIAGDAFVTTNQHSALSVMTQKIELCGPPMYFTPDWGSAASSVKKLDALQPEVLASGHGRSMYGEGARKSLHKLVRQFWQKAMPDSGRYVKEPALFNEDGVTYIPPNRMNRSFLAAVGITALAVVIGIVLYRKRKAA